MAARSSAPGAHGLRLGIQLDLARCPHCNVDRPNLTMVGSVETSDYAKTLARFWRFYQCARCGGITTAAAVKGANNSVDAPVIECYPGPVAVDEAVPDKARKFLEQAINSLHSPAGSIMLSASAIDAMLKGKGYKDGNLYERIRKAAADHAITNDMAEWAHDIRLDANDQRHADDDAELPSVEDAKRCLDFAQALAQFMFVLPARVTRGRLAATSLAPSA